QNLNVPASYDFVCNFLGGRQSALPSFDRVNVGIEQSPMGMVGMSSSGSACIRTTTGIPDAVLDVISIVSKWRSMDKLSRNVRVPIIDPLGYIPTDLSKLVFRVA